MKYKIHEITPVIDWLPYPKKWKMKVCRWLKIAPVRKFTVQLTIVVENLDGNANSGDVIRFDSGYSARVLEVTKHAIKCTLYHEYVNYFVFTAQSFDILGRHYAEK